MSGLAFPAPYRPQGLTAALGSSRVHARAGQAGQARWWGLCPLSDGENLTNHSLHLETQKWPLQHISFWQIVEAGPVPKMPVLNGTHFELKALSLLGDIFSSLCSFCHHLSPQLQPQAWRSCVCVKGLCVSHLHQSPTPTGLKWQVGEAESKRQDQQINIHQGCRTQVVPCNSSSHSV